MNVASVTVIAITQGFMFPSGVRNLDKILFSMPLFSNSLPHSQYVQSYRFISGANVRIRFIL